MSEDYPWGGCGAYERAQRVAEADRHAEDSGDRWWPVYLTGPDDVGPLGGAYGPDDGDDEV